MEQNKLQQSLLVDITNPKTSIENFENKLKLVKNSDNISIFFNKLFEKSLKNKTTDEKFQSLLFYLVQHHDNLNDFYISIKEIIQSNKSQAFFNIFFNFYTKTQFAVDYFDNHSRTNNIHINHINFLNDVFRFDNSFKHTSIYENNFLQIFLEKIEQYNLEKILENNPKIILPVNKYLTKLIQNAPIQAIKQVNQQTLIKGINNLFNKNNNALHNNQLLTYIEPEYFNKNILQNNTNIKKEIEQITIDNNQKLNYFESLKSSIPIKCLVASAFNSSVNQEKQNNILSQHLSSLNEHSTTLFINAINNNNKKAVFNLVDMNIEIFNDNKTHFDIARSLTEKLQTKEILETKKEIYFTLKKNGLNTNTTAFFYGLNSFNQKNNTEHTQEFNQFYIHDIGEENWVRLAKDLKQKGTVEKIIKIKTTEDFHYKNWFENYTYNFNEQEKKSLEQLIELASQYKHNKKTKRNIL